MIFGGEILRSFYSITLIENRSPLSLKIYLEPISSTYQVGSLSSDRSCGHCDFNRYNDWCFLIPVESSNKTDKLESSDVSTVLNYQLTPRTTYFDAGHDFLMGGGMIMIWWKRDRRHTTKLSVMIGSIDKT